MAKSELSLQRKIDRDKFIHECKMEGMNTKKALRNLSGNIKERSLDVKLVRWLQHPDIVNELANEVKRMNLTPETKKLIVEGRLIKILTDMEEKSSDAIQAGALMLKANGLLNESLVNIAIVEGSKLGNIVEARTVDATSHSVIEEEPV